LSSTLHYELLSSDISAVEKVIPELIIGYAGNQNQVFDKFPLDSGRYQSDVSEIMFPTIKKYGTEEWVAGVIANELHRHLGVYAIIGTKMGIRAREYFGAGIDEMKIVSSAGVIPPFSCMNDGLQVSTGATLGHGLISIKKDTLKLPEAEFSYMGRKVTISLKEKYRKRIESEISGYRLVYGLDSDIYWELVRKAALSYWSNWDRHEIFILNPDI
jgi:pyrimidine-specific ribonucleoside hydrolase